MPPDSAGVAPGAPASAVRPAVRPAVRCARQCGTPGGAPGSAGRCWQCDGCNLSAANSAAHGHGHALAHGLAHAHAHGLERELALEQHAPVVEIRRPWDDAEVPDIPLAADHLGRIALPAEHAGAEQLESRRRNARL